MLRGRAPDPTPGGFAPGPLDRLGYVALLVDLWSTSLGPLFCSEARGSRQGASPLGFRVVWVMLLLFLAWFLASGVEGCGGGLSSGVFVVFFEVTGVLFVAEVCFSSCG